MRPEQEGEVEPWDARAHRAALVSELFVGSIRRDGGHAAAEDFDRVDRFKCMLARGMTHAWQVHGRCMAHGPHTYASVLTSSPSHMPLAERMSIGLPDGRMKTISVA